MLHTYTKSAVVVQNLKKVTEMKYSQYVRANRKSIFLPEKRDKNDFTIRIQLISTFRTTVFQKGKNNCKK